MNNGSALPPLSGLQQVRFCELIQRMSDAIERGRMTPREERQCMFLLWELRDVHGLQTISATDRSSIARVKYVLPEDRRVPVAAIKDRMNSVKPGWTGIDLELEDHQSGLSYLADLEQVADDVVMIDVQKLPAWLKPRMVPPACDENA
ncbi:hypothetical protein AT984_08035 [Paucibacter sp. KCTC 42545]|nr:hypothetical protein AT984_08035 [Paucibacter sp. KCTC 42545]